MEEKRGESGKFNRPSLRQKREDSTSGPIFCIEVFPYPGNPLKVWPSKMFGGPIDILQHFSANLTYFGALFCFMHSSIPKNMKVLTHRAFPCRQKVPENTNAPTEILPFFPVFFFAPHSFGAGRSTTNFSHLFPPPPPPTARSLPLCQPAWKE